VHQQDFGDVMESIPMTGDKAHHGGIDLIHKTQVEKN
jgi:hypothetical protein